MRLPPRLAFPGAQECIEKYLRSNKLDKSRKTGFKCPRGFGKGTKSAQPCPGRVGPGCEPVVSVGCIPGPLP